VSGPAAAAAPPAARPRLSFGRLLLAALLAAPLASLAGALLAVAVDDAFAQARYSAGVQVAAFLITAFMAFVLVVPVLLLAALPMALLMQKLRVPPALADLLFIAAGILSAWLFAGLYPAVPHAFELGLCIGLATAVLWVLATRLVARRRPPGAAGPPHSRSMSENG